MRSRHFLSHSRQEALRIKKSGDPKDFRFPLEFLRRIKIEKNETQEKSIPGKPIE
jgi:hypothetical protein